jgi:hypothetical protein
MEDTKYKQEHVSSEIRKRVEVAKEAGAAQNEEVKETEEDEELEDESYEGETVSNEPNIFSSFFSPFLFYFF